MKWILIFTEYGGVIRMHTERTSSLAFTILEKNLKNCKN